MKVWKDKEGNKLTAKEFLSRWKEGIENITPKQKVGNELFSNVIVFVGYLIGFISLIYFIDAFPVKWFAYGLILIFFGLSWSSFIKIIALRQQLKLFKGIDSNVLDLSKVMKNLNEKEVKNNV